MTRPAKLIIEAAMDGKMPDLIKKKIDHRLDCHHYHCAAVSLDVGQSSRGETPCPSTTISILIEPEEEEDEVTIRESTAKKQKKSWHM